MICDTVLSWSRKRLSSPATEGLPIMGDTALTAACVRAATADGTVAITCTMVGADVTAWDVPTGVIAAGTAAAVGARGAAALAGTFSARKAANAGMVEYCASSCRKVIFTFI